MAARATAAGAPLYRVLQVDLHGMLGKPVGVQV